MTHVVVIVLISNLTFTLMQRGKTLEIQQSLWKLIFNLEGAPLRGRIVLNLISISTPLEKRG